MRRTSRMGYKREMKMVRIPTRTKERADLIAQAEGDGRKTYEVIEDAVDEYAERHWARLMRAVEEDQPEDKEN